MPNDPEQPQQIQINTTDEVSRGRYSNLMLVSHSQDEFILDWLLSSPNGAHLLSRIVMSPGNLKRAIAALTANLKQYEGEFGEVGETGREKEKVH